MAAYKQVFDILEVISDIIYAVAKLMRSGKQEDVSKVLGKEAHTTLVKMRSDLEALHKWQDVEVPHE